MTTTSPIKHVVVIYQENHSFDNVLGDVCQARLTRCDGFTGTVRLKTGAQVPMTVSPDVVPRVDHSVALQTKAIDGGQMDGWATITGCTPRVSYHCLSYYTASQIPNLASLANTYAVSDRTFSMADSPSWGGHLYAATSTLDGFTGDNPKPESGVTPGPGWGCDSNLTTPWLDPAGSLVNEPSCIPDYTLNPATYPYGGAFRSTPVAHVDTIFDRVIRAGLTFKGYGQVKAPTTTGVKFGGNPYAWSICPSLADCFYTPQRANMVPGAQVLTDATNGALPSYSIVTPSSSGANTVGGDTSQHNGAAMSIGDNWIGKVVSAVQSGPEAASTAVFITYDDCGCFYDHVAPGVNPDGTRQGIRMPMVIVSPYAKKGFTDSTPATFASILAFTEHTLGLAPLSQNDAQAYDYSDSFDFTQTPLAPTPMVSTSIPPSTRAALLANPDVGNSDAT